MMNFKELFAVIAVLVFLVSCGGEKNNAPSNLTGLKTQNEISSVSFKTSSNIQEPNILGIFELEASQEKGIIIKQLSSNINSKISFLTDVESDTSKTNIVFSGTAVAPCACSQARACGANQSSIAWANPAVCSDTAANCCTSVPQASIQQNVRYTNNTTFPIYETKAVFFIFTNGGSLDSNSEGYISSITVTSTQLSPNTQTLPGIDKGSANNGGGLSTTRLWIINAPTGTTSGRFLVMEYRWRTQTSGITNNLNGIAMFNGSTGYACGGAAGAADILKTIDGGSLWSAQVPAVNQRVNDCAISLVNSNYVWAVGNRVNASTWGIQRTTDGSNWVSDSPGGLGTARNLNSVYFLDNDTGWAVGNNGEILARNAAGWTNPASCNVAVNYNGVFARNATLAWAVGDSGVICQWDGISWNSQVSGVAANLVNLFFLDDNTGWVAGFSGTILKTTNGGGAWVNQTAAASACTGGANLGGVTFRDANNGWVVGTGAVICRTSDGGTTWTFQDDGLGGAPTYNEVDFKNDADGNHQLWMVGNGGRIRTYK